MNTDCTTAEGRNRFKLVFSFNPKKNSNNAKRLKRTLKKGAMFECWMISRTFWGRSPAPYYLHRLKRFTSLLPFLPWVCVPPVSAQSNTATQTLLLCSDETTCPIIKHSCTFTSDGKTFKPSKYNNILLTYKCDRKVNIWYDGIRKAKYNGNILWPNVFDAAQPTQTWSYTYFTDCCVSLYVSHSLSSTGSPPPSRLDICCLATPAPIRASGLSSPLQWNQPCMQMADIKSSNTTSQLQSYTRGRNVWFYQNMIFCFTFTYIYLTQGELSMPLLIWKVGQL